MDLIWKLTGKQNKRRSGIFGSPQGKISWWVIQSFTVSSHLILHSHLFSLWGEGTFSFFHLTHTPKLGDVLLLGSYAFPLCTPICGKVQRQRSLGNSLTSSYNLGKDFLVSENYMNEPIGCLYSSALYNHSFKKFFYSAEKSVNLIHFSIPSNEFILYLFKWNIKNEHYLFKHWDQVICGILAALNSMFFEFCWN